MAIKDVTNQFDYIDNSTRTSSVKDVTDQFRYVDGSQIGSLKPEEETNIFHEAAKGLAGGMQQVKGAGLGLQAIVGKLIGSKDITESAVAGMEEVEENTPRPAVGSYTEVEDIGSAAKYLSYGIASMLPNTLISLAPGGIGGAIGKMSTRKTAELAVTAALEKGMTKAEAFEIGKKITEKAIDKGFLIGGFTGSAGLETGTIAQMQISETGDVDIPKALGGGALAGSLDILPEWYVIKKLGLLGGENLYRKGTGIVSRIVAGGKAAWQGAIMEAPTEGIQTFIERASADLPLDTKEAYDDYINSLILGGATGGLFSGVGGFISKSQKANLAETRETGGGDTTTDFRSSGGTGTTQQTTEQATEEERRQEEKNQRYEEETKNASPFAEDELFTEEEVKQATGATQRALGLEEPLDLTNLDTYNVFPTPPPTSTKPTDLTSPVSQSFPTIDEGATPIRQHFPERQVNEEVEMPVQEKPVVEEPTKTELAPPVVEEQKAEEVKTEERKPGMFSEEEYQNASDEVLSGLVSFRDFLAKKKGLKIPEKEPTTLAEKDKYHEKIFKDNKITEEQYDNFVDEWQELTAKSIRENKNYFAEMEDVSVKETKKETKQEGLILKKDGSYFQTVKSAELARDTRQDLKGKKLEVVEVSKNKFGLREVKETVEQPSEKFSVAETKIGKAKLYSVVNEETNEVVKDFPTNEQKDAKGKAEALKNELNSQKTEEKKPEKEIKFTKTKDFRQTGEWEFSHNGVDYVTYRNTDEGGLGEWYVKRKGEKDYPKNSTLFNKEEVIKAVREGKITEQKTSEKGGDKRGLRKERKEKETVKPLEEVLSILEKETTKTEEVGAIEAEEEKIPTIEERAGEGVIERNDLLPEWTYKVDTNQFMPFTVNYKTKTITVESKNTIGSPARKNTVIGSVVASMLPEKLVTKFSDLMSYSLDPSKMRIAMGIEYGHYLDGIQKDPTLKEFFDNEIGTDPQKIVPMMKPPKAEKPNVGRKRTAKLMINKTPGKTIGVSKVQEIATKVTNILKNVIPIEVVASPDELSIEVLDSMKDIGGFDADGNVVANGVIHDGTIYIISSNISSERQAYATVLHELFHGGLRKAFESLSRQSKSFISFSRDLNSILKQIWKENSEVIMKETKEWNIDYLTEEGQLTAAEEWLASKAEDPKSVTWIDKLVSFVREFARKIGFKVMFSTSEINTLVMDSLKSVSLEKAPTVNKIHLNIEPLSREEMTEKDAAQEEENRINVERLQKENYLNSKENIFELPEMLDLVFDASGLIPRVRRYLGNQLGKFREDSGIIDLLCKLSPKDMCKVLAHNIGHLADWLPDGMLKKGNIFAKIASINNYMKSTLAEFEGAKGEITNEDRQRFLKQAQEEARKGDGTVYEYITRTVPEYETTDVTPEMILELLRGLTNQPKNVLDYLKSIDGREKAQIVRDAFKGLVKDPIASMGAKIFKREKVVTERIQKERTDFNKRVSDLFSKLLSEEIDKRKLYKYKEIMAELKELTRIWNPFDPGADDAYTKERHTPSELYAEAVSVFLNQPQLLADKAPTFHKAFKFWLDKKPGFKEAYDAINERLNDRDLVNKNREEHIRRMAMFDSVRRNILEQKKKFENRITGKGFLHDFLKNTVQKYIRSREYVQKWQKQGINLRDDQRIDYWFYEIPYIDSECNAYLRESEQIIKSASKDGISLEDLHTFLTLERAAYEKGRKEIANPHGVGGKVAEEVLAYIKQEMTSKYGAKKYNDLVKHANEFRNLYKKRVVKICEQAGFLRKELIEYMLNNDYYVTYDFKTDFDERYGSNNSAHIYNQYGGLGDIKNTVIATMLKGEALIRAARHHQTKMGVLQTLAELGDTTDIIPAKRIGIARSGFENPPKGYGLVVVSPNGKMEGYFIDEELAAAWNKNRDQADSVFRLGMASKAIIAKLFIQWNPGWIAANIIRDMLGTWKKMPGSFGLIFKAYKNTFKDAWDAGMEKLPERELRLMRNRIITAGRFFQGNTEMLESEIDYLKSLDTKDKIYQDLRNQDEIKGFYQRFREGIDKFEKSGMDKYFLIPPYLRMLEKIGKASERWGKFAGEEILKMQMAQGKEMGAMKFAQDIRSRSGSPDFMQGGLYTKWLEIIFPFSRISIQDIVSGVSSAKERPGAYILKTITLNVLPKVFVATAAMGLAGEELEDKASKISRYYRMMYNCIPFADLNGQTVFIKIPQDYTGQAIGAVVDSMLRGETTGTVGMLGAVAGYQPYNVNPFLSVAEDWINYLVSNEVPVNFYGQPIMKQQVALAGGARAYGEMGKMTFNEFFGGMIYRFESTAIERVEPWQKEILKTHPFSSIGRFIGITDTGLEEHARLLMMETRKNKANKSLDVADEISQIINEARPDEVEEKILDYYVDAVEKGKINPRDMSAKEFANTWNNIALRKNTLPEVRAMAGAMTIEEKVDYVIHMEKTYRKERLDKVMSTFEDLDLLSPSFWRKYYEKKELNK